MTCSSRSIGATMALMLVVTSIVFGALAPHARAQTSLTIDPNQPGDTGVGATPGNTTPAGLGSGGTGGTGGGASPSAPGPKPDASKGGAGSNDYNPGILESIFNYIMAKIASLFAWILGVAAIILDYVVYYTVIKMGDFVHNIANIGVAWRVLRDLGNILLIFGFLIAGIAVIVNASFYGFGSKMLPMLLVAAVFINFSLFISEAIIDVGNLFATEIYTQINNGQAPTPDTMKGLLTDVSNEGISNRIMSVLGLATVYQEDANGKNTISSTQLNGSGPWYVGFMSIILFLVAAFVFLSLAFILVARFVALILLMVVAPLGFAGLAIPKLSNIAGTWWRQVAEQTLTAPVLLLLLYVALAVITDSNFLLQAGGSSGGANAAGGAWQGFLDGKVSGLSGFAGILLAFVIAMALLLAVVVVAKRMSAFGASWATSMGGRALALGLSAPVNAAGYGLRRATQSISPNSRTSRFLTRYAFRPMTNARVDIRRAGVGQALGAFGAGEGAKPITKAPGTFIRESREKSQKWTQEQDRTSQRQTAVPRLEQAVAAGNYAAAGRIIGSFSDKDLETPEVRRALKNPAAAAALSQSKFDKLMDSDQVPDTDKAAIRAARNKGVTDRYKDAGEFQDPTTRATRASQDPNRLAAHRAAVAAAVAAGTPPPPLPTMSRGEQAVRAASNEQASQMPDTALAEEDIYRNLKLSQVNAIQRAGKLDPSIASTIGAWLNSAPPAGAPATDLRNQFQTYLAGLNPGQRTDAKAFWGLP